MKTFIAAVAALFIGSSASVAMAQGRHGGDGVPGLRMMLKTAGLTSSQEAQVHDIMKSSWAQRKAFHSQIKALREEISDKLASAGSVSASDITSIQSQIAQIRSQMDAQSVQTALQVRALLTADQLRQVSQAHAQIKSLHTQLKALMPAESAIAPQ